MGCESRATIDVATASLSNAQALAKACLLYAHLHKDHGLPPHLAWLFYDPQMKGEGVPLNVYSSTRTGLPRFHTDWTPSNNWAEIAAEVDRVSDFIYTGAELTLAPQGDPRGRDIVIFYSKSPIHGKGYLVGQLDGDARFVDDADLSAVLVASNKLRVRYLPSATQP